MKIDQDSARVRIPPPLIAFSFALLGYALHRYHPLPLEGMLFRIAGGALIAAGLGLILFCAGLFRKFQTHIEPWKTTSAIITTGVYAYSRNPIYLAFILIGSGLSLVLQTGWILILQWPLILVLNWYVIRKEENYLRSKFGDEYLRYTKTVRRWI